MNANSASKLSVVLLCAAAGLLCACSTLPRAPAPLTAAASAAPVGFSTGVRFVGIDPDSLDQHAVAVVAAANDGPVNALALSGGGAGGAFGAGALVGMSRRGDRPTFQVVTGVSVGALLAPFAFLGPAWDSQMLAAAADGRIQKLLRVGGPAILFRASVYDGSPLRALVDQFVTQPLVDAVAQEAARGRLLLVATTDLDKQEPVIWDMGAIAAEGGEAARTLFRDVLVASASIPGVFPPVLIRVRDGAREYEEMHVDGSTTVPFFVAPEILQLRAGRVLDLHGGKIYILVNGALSARPMTTRAGSLAVISRAFSASSIHGSRRTLELAAEFARRQGMDLQFSYIPMTYPYQGPLAFEAEELRRLFEFAQRCAETGELWTRIEAAIDEGRKSAFEPSSPPACPGPADTASSRVAAIRKQEYSPSVAIPPDLGEFR